MPAPKPEGNWFWRRTFNLTARFGLVAVGSLKGMASADYVIGATPLRGIYG